MHQDDLKENDKFILFCKIALGKTQARHSFPQTEATTFAFSSVFIFLLCLHLRDLCLYPSSMRESNAEKKDKPRSMYWMRYAIYHESRIRTLLSPGGVDPHWFFGGFGCFSQCGSSCGFGSSVTKVLWPT